MRVNVYAEEMTDRIEIISKTIGKNTFTGLRFYLELPTSVPTDFAVRHSPYLDSTKDASIKKVRFGKDAPTVNIQGQFRHELGDDDSAAVTFWGKADLRVALQKAIEALDKYYAERNPRA